MDIFLVLIVAIAILSFANALLLSISDIQANVTKTQTFEAAFQGRCNDKTPCQQLCVQSHDGTYECACRKGYQLSLDGYTCNHINSKLVQLNLTVTTRNNTEELAYRDVFYQSVAIISASLEKDTTNITKDIDSCSINCGPNAYCYQDDYSREQLCECKLGFSGSNCNQKIEINVAKFNGNGWIRFVFDSNNNSDHLDVEFQVRPQSYDGLLLWLNLNDDNSTDYQNAYMLFLKDGFLNFRFPNGSAIAKMQSNARIVLQQWNLIKLFRYQSFARLQLNDDIKTTNFKNKSKQISWKSEFYIGGISEDLMIPNNDSIANEGFRGCFKHFRFNNFKYLFNKADNNYAPLDGVSVDECAEETCLNNDLCQNSGVCKLIYNKTSGSLQPKCYCHFGNYGDSCEQVVQSQILFFDYNSFFIKKQLAPYFNDNRTRHNNYLEIDFEIRPQQLSGSILYGLPYMTYYYQVATFENCLFALFLDNGFLEFIFKTSTDSYQFRTNKTLSLNHWHRINVYQNSHIIYLRINNSEVYTFMKDSYQVNSRLLVPEKLIFGRIQTSTSRTSQLKHLYSFKGNLKHIRLNNRPIKAQSVISNRTFQDICIDNCENDECPGSRCQESNMTKLVPFIPQFRASRNSYIFSNDTDLLEELHSDNYQINLRLKTTSINGLILYYNYNNRFLSIEVIDRFLVTRISIQDGFLIAQSNSFEISDNLWHRLEIYRQKSKLRIKIDNKQMTTKQSLNLVENFNVNDWYLNHGLYIGGQETSSVYRNLNGCLFDIVLNSYVSVPLMTGCNKIAYCTEH